MQMPHGQIHPCLFWDKGVVRVPFHGVGKQFSHLGLLSSDLTALTWPENIFAICCSFLFQRELNKCLDHDTSEGSENTLMSLYNVFVMWNFSYYNTIWHFCNTGVQLRCFIETCRSTPIVYFQTSCSGFRDIKVSRSKIQHFCMNY